MAWRRHSHNLKHTVTSAESLTNSPWPMVISHSRAQSIRAQIVQGLQTLTVSRAGLDTPGTLSLKQVWIHQCHSVLTGRNPSDSQSAAVQNVFCQPAAAAVSLPASPPSAGGVPPAPPSSLVPPQPARQSSVLNISN